MSFSMKLAHFGNLTSCLCLDVFHSLEPQKNGHYHCIRKNANAIDGDWRIPVRCKCNSREQFSAHFENKAIEHFHVT